jgi:hypothetical protein
MVALLCPRALCFLKWPSLNYAKRRTTVAQVYQERSYQEHLAQRMQQKAIEFQQYCKQQQAAIATEMQGIQSNQP